MKDVLKRFKDNMLFFIITFVIVLFFIIISLVIKSNYSGIEEVEELPENGTITTSKIVISEIQSSNNGTLVDGAGNSYDWIEIYNGSSKDKKLDNYSLSDRQNEIKWAFPSGTVIRSGEYLVVFLSGTMEDGMHANFKLKSSGGEYLVLRNSKKKIIDAIETVAMSKNQVMSRMENGSFVISSFPTPGFENSKDGYNKFVESIGTTEEKSLAITEILPNNKGYFKDIHGEYSGYIEITNITNSSVSLKGYNISNNLSALYKWKLPEITLKSKQSIVIYTSNKNSYEEEYHANFKLDNRNGVVILTNGNLIEDKVEYTGLANGLAYIKEDGKYFESNLISPGFDNTAEGIKEFEKKYLLKGETLIINEAMNSNYSYLPQNSGNYYDWIELYNNSKETIKLSDYYLTTNMDNPKLYNLPKVELESGKYFIIMASGDTNLSNNSYYHANFKISDNEGLFLYKNNKVVDSIFISNVPVGYSYGYGKDAMYYYSSPTPGNANKTGNMQISYTPTFSEEAGVYNNIDSLVINIKGEGNVYYTTDGSSPTSSSKLYTGPITLKNTTVLKAISTSNGKMNSDVVTASYIINENHTLPVMSLSISPGDFSSITRNAWTVDYEKEAYAEFFEKDGTFSLPTGLKLFGGSARSSSKKSFSINFRKKYGEGTLNYQVFKNRDNSIYDSLVLRTGSQDESAAIIRDILGTSLVDGMINVDVQAYKSIILYINGKYWGVYFIREKVTEDFVASHYNVDGTGTNIVRIDNDTKIGTNATYKELISYVNSHNLANDEYYNHVASLVDIDSLIDFWVAETYVTNNDIVNCRFFSNPNVDDGKWNFIFFDLDYAFYNYFLNYYNFSTKAGGMGVNYLPTTLLRNLMKNSQFKKRYVERVSYQLKNVWTIERVTEFYNNILDELNPEMERNFSRWSMNNMSHWKSELKELMQYFEKRNAYMISQTKSYFGLSAAEMKEYFGG